MPVKSRREFLTHAGLGAAALPFLSNLPSLGFENQGARKQRLIVMFSPNGTLPKEFWPEQAGEAFELKSIMKPLEAIKDRMASFMAAGFLEICKPRAAD